MGSLNINHRKPLGFFLILVCLSPVAFLFTNIASSNLIGYTDGIFPYPTGDYVVSGWACEVGNSNSINVDLYAGTNYIGTYFANSYSEPAVAASCRTATTNSRYNIILPTAAYQYSGLPLFVYPAGGAVLPYSNSTNNFTIPLAQSSALRASPLNSCDSLSNCINTGTSFCEVVAGSNSCSVSIQWSSPSALNSCVFAKKIGDENVEKLFACSSNGMGNSIANFIQENQFYEFSLHADNNFSSPILSRINIQGKKEYRIESVNNLCSTNSLSKRCSSSDTVIRWKGPTISNSGPCVFVAKNGDLTRQKLMACGSLDQVSPSWIQEGAYKFILRESNDPTSALIDSLWFHGFSHGLGFNYFPLSWEMGLFPASELGGVKPIGTNLSLPQRNKMGQKSLNEISQLGFSFIRFFAFGYYAQDVASYLANPTAYKTKLIALFDKAQSLKIKLVPTIFLYNDQVPSYVRSISPNSPETVVDLLRNPNSKSRAIAKQMVQDLISAVGNHPALHFIEITNEFNLMIGIPFKDDLGNVIPGCITTDNIVGFTTSITQLIHLQNPNILVSSGFALSRPAESHLEEKMRANCLNGTETITPDWTLDNLSEFQSHLQRLNSGVDIAAIHVYAGNGNLNRFNGLSTDNDANIIQLSQDAISQMGKALYVGEFGLVRDGTGFTQYETHPFFTAFNSLYSRSKIAFASPWIWAFYQFQLFRSPYLPIPPLPAKESPQSDYWFSIEPGFRNNLINGFQDSSGIIRGSPQMAGKISLNCLISWPTDGSTQVGKYASSAINVMASDISQGNINSITSIKLTITASRLGQIFNTWVHNLDPNTFPYILNSPFPVSSGLNPGDSIRVDVIVNSPNGTCTDTVGFSY